MLLYTDGLVERRDEALDAGLDRLARAAGTTDGPVDDALTALVERMLAEVDRPDDVCLLMAQWQAVELELELAGDLAGLRGARNQVRAWLGALQVDGEVVTDLVLAVSETLANAGEHGARLDATSVVRLAGRLEDGPDGQQVVLEVIDVGSWTVPAADAAADDHAAADLAQAVLPDSAVPVAPDADRGRGRNIIRHLVDEFSTERSPTGTVVRLSRRLPAPTASRDGRGPLLDDAPLDGAR